MIRSEVIDYIRKEIRPRLKKAQIERMMDYLYSSEYVRSTGNWQEVIDIILSRPDVYPLYEDRLPLRTPPRR